ncbi:MAG: hypothetical protein J6T32_02470 [Paludibacteraceae bacterium]|nr:hypothetical protein [Paludibacteraceae bacterium]
MKTKSIFLLSALMLSVSMFGQTFAIAVYEDCDKNGAIKSSTGGIAEGHEYVDLGLSVYWATTNIGTNIPEEPGDYYPWGATSIPSLYSWRYYVHGYEDYNNKNWVRKYCTIESQKYYGMSELDNLTQLLDVDDAAHVLWGGDWHIPTSAQARELVDSCKWEYTSLNGVWGYRITSKVTGYTNNSIFLPSTGYMAINTYTNNSNTLTSASNSGYYWLSELNSPSTTSFSAYSLRFYSDSSHGVSSLNMRSYGCPIRPVMSKGL